VCEIHVEILPLYNGRGNLYSSKVNTACFGGAAEGGVGG
jgi:hypothetical protein